MCAGSVGLIKLQQRGDSRRTKGRTRRRRLPAEQCLGRTRADPPLTRAHAAVGGKLGLCPARLSGKGRMGDVFAATDQRVWASQVAYLFSQHESLIQAIGETLPALALWPKGLGLLRLPDGGMPGDGAFHQGQFAAAETGALTRRIVMGKAGGLPRIHDDGVFL